MPRLSEFRLIYQQEQPVLVIPAKTNLKNLTAVIKENKKKIKKYLDTIGEYPADVSFVTYHNGDVENLDIDICFPTRKPLKGQGEIRYSSILPSKAIICMLIGDHEERKKIYAQMQEWIKDNGFKYAGEAYEYFYFDSRKPDNPHLFTKIIMIVK